MKRKLTSASVVALSLCLLSICTGLLLRTEELDATGKITGAVEYWDYREVDGVKVPFVIYQVQDVHVTIKLTEVKHNVPIDDTVFVKPAK